jgi:hypothetical protein
MKPIVKLFLLILLAAIFSPTFIVQESVAGGLSDKEVIRLIRDDYTDHKRNGESERELSPPKIIKRGKRIRTNARSFFGTPLYGSLPILVRTHRHEYLLFEKRFADEIRDDVYYFRETQNDMGEDIWVLVK